MRANADLQVLDFINNDSSSSLEARGGSSGEREASVEGCSAPPGLLPRLGAPLVFCRDLLLRGEQMPYQASGGKSHLGTSRSFLSLSWNGHTIAVKSHSVLIRSQNTGGFVELRETSARCRCHGGRMCLRGREAGSSLVLYNSPPSIRTGGF